MEDVRLPEVTAAVLVENRYCIGDVAGRDERCHLQFSGRAEDLIICSQGEHPSGCPAPAAAAAVLAAPVERPSSFGRPCRWCGAP